MLPRWFCAAKAGKLQWIAVSQVVSFSIHSGLSAFSSAATLCYVSENFHPWPISRQRAEPLLKSRVYSGQSPWLSQSCDLPLFRGSSKSLWVFSDHSEQTEDWKFLRSYSHLEVPSGSHLPSQSLLTLALGPVGLPRMMFQMMLTEKEYGEHNHQGGSLVLGECVTQLGYNIDQQRWHTSVSHNRTILLEPDSQSAVVMN